MEPSTPEMTRYARIETKFPREFLLLQGTGCIWKRCTFCDYHTDTSADPFAVNKPILDQIRGDFGTVDVINSGSIFELDPQSLAYLRKRLNETAVTTLWCEAHWLYRTRLDEIRRYFPGITVKFRAGIETFDPDLRSRWNKGIGKDVTPEQIARDFAGICLLVCVAGQTRSSILNDIAIAQKHFEYFSVNVFCENSTPVKRDPALVQWFTTEIAPTLSAEVLIDNTDLGVGDARLF